MATVALDLPVRRGPALPNTPPGADQPGLLARGAAAMTVHGPLPPLWSCAGCGAAWSCPTRRHQLRAEYADAPVSLRLYLASCFVAAAEDLTWIPSGVLYQRFIGWSR